MKRRLPGLVLLFVLLALLLSATVLAADSTIIEVDQTYVDTKYTGFWELQAGNTYQLIGHVTIDGSYLRVATAPSSEHDPATLDLNGYTLTIKNPPSANVPYYNRNEQEVQETSPVGILVFSSPDMNALQWQLTLTDSSTTKTGKLDVQGRDAIGIYVGRNCTLNIEGGTITNSSYSESNQSEHLYSVGVKTVLGTVNMTGGRIEKQYIGVELSGGTFTMDSNAEIAGCGYLDNDGRAWGCGVDATVGYQTENNPSDYKASTLTMDGGTIRNCMSAAGGGVHLSGSSTFTMSGGTITGCKAAYDVSSNGNGGGVYVGNGTFTMDGGTISNCEATNHGGGVFVGDGMFNMSGTAKITGCTAGAGGGVSANEPLDVATFTMSGNAEITGCEAVGGGAYIGKCNFTMSGEAKITDCTAAEYTGNVNKDGDCILIESADSATLNIADSVTISGQITQGFQGIRIDGLGTEKFPYQIGDKDELVLFGSIVNGTAKGITSSAAVPAQRDACAELTADIDLENAAWTPIGQNTGSLDETLAYSGTFNGNGHTISGLNVTGDFNYSGLFSYTEGATIRNLTVAGSVTGPNESGTVGGIVGYASHGTIENCGNLCKVNGNAAGGIVGHAYNTTISACYNAGAISGGSNAAGGLVGWFQGSKGEFYDCYNVGTVYSDKNSAGGIVGLAGTCSVYNCYNAGAVTGVEAYGIGSGAEIKNSYYPNGTTADPNATEMSTEEFADRTVLKALKDGKHKSEDPWADECQYVDAAGMTLPVFKDQNTHKHDLTYVPAKAPTTSADGNIEYWYCPICGKYFSDANGDHEITEADTVLARLHYSGGSSPSYPITVSENTAHGTVTVTPKTASAGATVTITATPDSGYVLETVTAVDKQGNELKLTNKGGGKYTFTMPSGKVEVSATFMEDNSLLNVFYDVPNGVYYYDAVKWAVKNGITGGVGNSLFAPNRSCTRAEIVTFLWRSAGSPVVNYLMPFTDVEEGAYYAEAVRWAASAGIVNGLTETVFGTDDVCTRAQAAAMIYRYVQAQGGGFTGAWMFLLPFNDTPDWAYESIAWCYQRGITSGTTATTFSPDAPCTRAQIVTFLYRAMQ